MCWYPCCYYIYTFCYRSALQAEHRTNPLSNALLKYLIERTELTLNQFMMLIIWTNALEWA